MIVERLQPNLELLREEYVLVQAWKKTATYIRYHNWFSDTLAIDRAAVNLRPFLTELRERLGSRESWKSDPLRIVPAPKSQRWRADPQSGAWEPIEKGATPTKLRPLAHVSLADQVVATAVMLCLADRVETRQGDPRSPTREAKSRMQIVSYGNRLFCDAVDGGLRHRWGSSKLYRAYYQDYRAFLARPEAVADPLLTPNGKRVFVVHADLRQFYDRVRPDSLARAMEDLRRGEDERDFFCFAKSVLDWRWHDRDQNEVRIYAQQAGIGDFTRVALPQGLVASGFFANVVLLGFDAELKRLIGTEVEPRIRIADACRYVDDLRITVAVEPQLNVTIEDVGRVVCKWLDDLLKRKTTGLELSPEKTKVAAFGREERPLVRQSARMNRIQTAVSGGFDAIGGEEILDAIQGVMRSQEALRVADESDWRLSPVPDVRDETVARFGATRFRTTFRSIRPLLEDEERTGEADSERVAGAADRVRVGRTRRELDGDARAFALGLIQRWVQDPANVRLLLIGLDLWPDVEVLREVLSLLRPFTEKGGRRKAPRRVAWYCLAEVLRAGATETGLVTDAESLPSGTDLQAYREELRDEAARLVALPLATIPWYLRQQALLFLAAFAPASAPIVRRGTNDETRHYRELIRFLRCEGDRLRDADFATFAVLARRAFANSEKAIGLTRPALNTARRREIAERDPSFMLELMNAEPKGRLFGDLPARAREDLFREFGRARSDGEVLAEIVLREHPTGSLRNELGLLRFAAAFLRQWRQQENRPEVITPGQVELDRKDDAVIADIEGLRILGSRVHPSGSLYQTPEWCEEGQRWRFQLGFLLRFILSGQPDFTRPVRPAHWKESESAYRPAESHWYQRLYGLFSGQPAFGDDWLPITDWVERLLLALLRWPGCRAPEGFDWVEGGVDEAIDRIQARICELERRRGRATEALLLPLVAKRPTTTNTRRPLRGCVIQTAIPTACDFCKADLALDARAIRRKHRNHLSAALAAVKRMLALRETHKGSAGGLDWLILPELAAHPNDVRTHLIPFARAHRTMIVTGLTYSRLLSDQPLVNSALWIIPECSDAHGLQIRTRRQGKAHLAPDEQRFNEGATRRLQGFRPCQWLVGYPWSDADRTRPIWLTASVCYDATDLGLAADLRDASDVLAIPALNKDVKTFDQMALALHYHMFQLIVVANNGKYGGSNAYWPMKQEFVRQVFHMHGQPQASIAFFEIDDIQKYLRRRDPRAAGAGNWKHPPAGLRTASSGEEIGNDGDDPNKTQGGGKTGTSER